jgi:Rad3-related DNA helicase
VDFFGWLRDNWDRADVLCGQLPVGSGKSAIARAIQMAVGAHVITPSNILIEQYRADYKAVNYLKGKAHYQCTSGLSCSDWQDVLEQPACASCPYKQCKERAYSEPTFFNPLSLYYFRLAPGSVRPAVLVVDEAHQLASMILMLCAKKFRRGLYKFDERCTHEVYLIEWMAEQLRKLNKLAALYTETRNYKKLAEITAEIESIAIVKGSLQSDPQNYAIYIEQGKYRGRPETYLQVRPIRPPREVVRRLLDCGKLILLSGTLLPTDIEDLAAERHSLSVDLPSPIPKERRPILYRPAQFPVNHATDPALIARAIEGVVRDFPGRNAIVHVSYSLSAKLVPHLRIPVIHNTPETKTDALERFKRLGGVFLAAGCAEGLDLKDDLCRLNIIPRLSYPDLKDPVVQKRKALHGGDEWYALETLKVAVQQTGRSTRHENDESTTVVLDPNFSRIVNRYKKKLPQSFVEAIRWTGR